MDLCFDIFAIQILICVACNRTLCSNQMIEFVFNLVLPNVFLFAIFGLFLDDFLLVVFGRDLSQIFLGVLLLESL